MTVPGRNDAARRPADRSDTPPDEADVLRFLGERPDFLQRHPSLYLALVPPARVHGEALADHMAAMLAAARGENAALRTDVTTRRRASSWRDRAEAAILGLLRAAVPREWIETELAATIGLDAAHLPPALPLEDARILLRGRDVVLRTARGPDAAPAPGDPAPDASGRGDTVSDAARLHGAAAPLVRADALLRIRGRGDRFAILALASREPDAFAGADAALVLLGRAVEAALDRS
jgi:uncharacterized protein YigA (DUF484 family)